MKINQSVKFLLSHIFNMNYVELERLCFDRGLLENFTSIIRRGIPPQYIVAQTDFFETNLLVAPGVFIPRPETEGLIDLIFGVKEYRYGLEIGCGSGALSITFLSKIPGLFMVGTEISVPSIEICLANLIYQKLSDRMGIVISPNLDPFQNDFFDLVVSNPPYIPTRELHNLSKRVQYEPVVAIDGGKDGICALKLIVEGAERVLKKSGVIGLEIDPSVSRFVPDLFKGFNRFTIHQDYSGRDRYVIGEK